MSSVQALPSHQAARAGRRRWRLLALGSAAPAAVLLLAYAAAVVYRGPVKFTIIALPDTQYYVEQHPDILTDQVDWILSEREPRNIVFVAHEGDIVEHYDRLPEWRQADEILSRLIGVIPFGILPGNHDMSPEGEADEFNRTFSAERFLGFSWYGEAYPAGTNENSFQLFSAGGYDFGPFSLDQDRFLILNLRFCPPPDVIAWANRVLDQYPGRHAIVVTHAYLGVFGQRNITRPAFGCSDETDNTQYLFDELIYPHASVFLVLSGHDYDTQDADGEAYRVDLNAAGRPVHQLLADFQRRPQGGEGWLRIIGFNREIRQVIVRTYSPTRKQYEQDEDSDFRFDYPLDLE
jgi:3',5'-cyclic AMP phosphodiesterase CpdA